MNKDTNKDFRSRPIYLWMLRPCPGRLNYRKSPKSTSDHRTGLLVLQLLQPPDCGLDCDSRSCVVSPGTSSHRLPAGPTVPDTNSPPLHLGLATERAGVFSVLGDFNFLHHLPQRGTVTCAIFTNDPHLLGTLGHRFSLKKRNIIFTSQSF